MTHPAAFTADSLKAYIAATPQLSRHFDEDISTLDVSEIGDGNLNFVFFVRGKTAALAIKQALPFSRMSKGTRALSCDRLGFETRALQIFAKCAPDLVPAIFHYDEERSLMAQSFLSPHIILRKGLIEGVSYPRLAKDMGQGLARYLFGTSDFALQPSEKRPLVADFTRNIELCEITERLVFTHPFMDGYNNPDAPMLGDKIARIRSDARLQLRLRELKLRFLSRTDALLHGDLHSGSIMLTPEDTKVIDPEFATFGPMGFDIGMLLGNLMLSYFAQPAYGERAAYQQEILTMIETIWSEFVTTFRDLAAAGQGVLCAPPSGEIEGFDNLRAAAIEAYLQEVLHDTIGYAAVEMIRRITGVAQIIDFQEITDAHVRAACEKPALDHAIALLTATGKPEAINALTAVKPA